MQNRAIRKQIGQHHFLFRVLFIMALYYDLSGDFFRLEIATSIARPRVESGRGHEGVAPRCATLCATLHQLRRFKGKCCRSYFRKSATVAFSFVWFVVHVLRFLNDKRSEFLIYDYQKFLDVNRSE